MPAAPVYAHVNEPGRIGNLELRNRLVRMGAGAWPGANDPEHDRCMPQDLIDYYEDLAAGGSAIVAIPGGYVNLVPDSIGMRVEPDDCIPDLKRITDAIHKHGAYAFIQCMSTGPSPFPHVESIASSDLSQEDLDKLIPFYAPSRAVTKEEIRSLVRRYGEFAKRFKKAGFDGIELNSAHVHFLNTFLSPAWNKRTDEYGPQNAENRTRIVREIIQEIKRVCGEDFPIISLINVVEYGYENGITNEMAAEHARWIESAGADCIHCRAEMAYDRVEGVHERMSYECPDITLYPEFVDVDLTNEGIQTKYGNGVAGWSLGAEAVKKAVSIPVMLVGRMDADIADQLIGEGKIDFANICRRNLADPDYVNKALTGQRDEIRPCVGCFTCYDMSERGQRAWCMVNPSLMMGKEYSTIEPAEAKKRVLVIGSGAAGLEAARVLALRGHEVILAEKDKEIGGTLPMAAMIKDFHEDFLSFSQWQVRQVKKLGVDIRTNTEVDESYVRKIGPDAVIVAVGGAEPELNIPGLDNKIVTTGEDLHKQLRRALKVFSIESIGKLSKMFLPLGHKVILLGGGIQGIQTAAFLVKRSREVVIIEEADELGAGMIDLMVKPNMLRWLLNSDMVDARKNTKVKEITKKGVVVISPDGSEELIEGDSVVTTPAMETNMGLFNKIREIVPETYAVGDCNPLVIEEEYPEPMVLPIPNPTRWPSYTTTAVREAYRICREI